MAANAPQEFKPQACVWQSRSSYVVVKGAAHGEAGDYELGTRRWLGVDCSAVVASGIRSAPCAVVSVESMHGPLCDL